MSPFLPVTQTSVLQQQLLSNPHGLTALHLQWCHDCTQKPLLLAWGTTKTPPALPLPPQRRWGDSVHIYFDACRLTAAPTTAVRKGRSMRRVRKLSGELTFSPICVDSRLSTNTPRSSAVWGRRRGGNQHFAFSLDACSLRSLLLGQSQASSISGPDCLEETWSFLSING